MNMGIGVVASVLLAAPAAADAPAADQDVICMIMMTDAVARAHARTDLPPEYADTVTSFQNSIGYFVGAAATRYGDAELTQAIAAAQAEFAGAGDKTQLLTQCDGRYRQAMVRMYDATRRAHAKMPAQAPNPAKPR
jgi:hypothetical protein